MDKVLVAGATGRLGREIIKELKQQGYWTRALVRDPHKLGAASVVDDVRPGDAHNPATLAGVCDGIDVVVSTMGASLELARTRDQLTYWDVYYEGNKRLLEQAMAAGVRKFVYVSLCGVEQMTGVAYVDAHEAFVRALQASNLDHTIIRPTGFFYVFAEIFKMAQRGRVMLIGDGSARTNPIHEADLACVCVDAINAREHEIGVGGPQIYTRREISELAFATLGKRVKTIQLPASLVRAMVRPVRLLDRRLFELLDFGVVVNTVDVVAPPRGTHTLPAFFQQLAQGSKSSSHLG